MVNFFTEGVDYKLSLLSSVPPWLVSQAELEQKHLSELNYIFCSDEYLLQINRQYLSHDFFTDIITFDNADHPGLLEGDIFISLDRVRENSAIHQTTFFSELLRVIIHGLLHLIGFDDKDDKSKAIMRKMEDKYLDLYFQNFHKADS